MRNLPLISRLFRPSVKSLADPGADLFALFGVTQSAGGVTVSPEAAIRVPVVNAALRLISDAIAALPVSVVERLPGGKAKALPDHEAAVMLSGQVNDWTSGFEFIRDLMVDALLEDRGGLAYANRASSGRVVELIRYRPGLITVDFHQATGERF